MRVAAQQPLGDDDLLRGGVDFYDFEAMGRHMRADANAGALDRLAG
jgi:hypothetical protein